MDATLDRRDTVALLILALVSRTPSTLYQLLRSTGLAKGSVGAAVEGLRQAHYVREVSEDHARRRGYVLSAHRQTVWEAAPGGEEVLHQSVTRYAREIQRLETAIPADFEQALRWIWVLRMVAPDHVGKFLKRLITQRETQAAETRARIERDMKNSPVVKEFWQLRNIFLAGRYESEAKTLRHLSSLFTPGGLH